MVLYICSFFGLFLKQLPPINGTHSAPYRAAVNGTGVISFQSIPRQMDLRQLTRARLESVPSSSAVMPFYLPLFAFSSHLAVASHMSFDFFHFVRKGFTYSSWEEKRERELPSSCRTRNSEQGLYSIVFERHRSFRRNASGFQLLW